MAINEVIVDAKQITAQFPASTASARGNLLYWDASAKLAKNAAARSDLGTVALNQADFAPLFLGVARDQRLASETTSGSSRGATNSLRVVVQDGVFDCACASLTWKIGDLVGIDRDGTNSVNYNQQVAKVTGHPHLSFGVCVQEEDVATTIVRARLVSRIALTPGDRLDYGVGGFQGQGVTVLADSAVTLTVDSNPMLSMVPTAARNVTLPAEAQSTGLMFFFTNNSGGADSVTFLASGGGGIKGNGVVPQNKTAILWCDGTHWNGNVSA